MCRTRWTNLASRVVLCSWCWGCRAFETIYSIQLSSPFHYPALPSFLVLPISLIIFLLPFHLPVHSFLIYSPILPPFLSNSYPIFCPLTFQTAKLWSPSKKVPVHLLLFAFLDRYRYNVAWYNCGCFCLDQINLEGIQVLIIHITICLCRNTNTK